MDKQNPIRHSCAHLLAASVLELFPQTKLTIGPAIENGFYYDFEFKNPITDLDLLKIEKKMLELLPTWTHFTKREVSGKEAKEIYKNNPYKLELIEEIESKGEPITLYKAGDFEDLCRGGHSENPAKEISVLKLLSIVNAYWRGDETNQMLTRIYGTCFNTQEELDKYLSMLEEAKKRDHRKIGRELELFFTHDYAPGAPFWLPKGMVIFKELEKYIRELTEKAGYLETSTPIMVKSQLFKESGHWIKFGEHNMYNLILSDDENDKHPESYTIKPMNCPESTILYRFRPRTYKELPLRLSELGRLHRREKSGEVNGLLRVRQLTMDDAHIYAREDQIFDEVSNILDMMVSFYKNFEFEYEFRFATRPETRAGTDTMWDKAEKDLEEVLKKKGIKAGNKKGDGAFYGPKIDLHIKDALGREWQLATVQLDFHMPQAFDLKYVNEKGEFEKPVMIHRAIFGSFERFIGILTEHFQGAFPLWLSPVQITILPITDKQNEYGEKLLEEFRENNIRAELDSRGERLQAKIRDATLQKVPYLGIIGEREVENRTISVRERSGKDLGSLKLSDFLDKLKKEIDKKV